MPLSMTPGSSIIASPELRCRHGLRRDLSSSVLPILPAIRFTRGKYFGASRFTHWLRHSKLLAPLYGSDRHARPPCLDPDCPPKDVPRHRFGSRFMDHADKSGRVPWGRILLLGCVAAGGLYWALFRTDVQGRSVLG